MSRLKITEVVLVLLTLAVLVAVLCGCGSTTDRQTKIVEREEWVIGPMVAEIPLVGTATVQPTRVVHQRTQDEVEKTEKTINTPDLMPIVTAAAGGAPWGGILATAAGLVGAFVGKKALDNARQRNELIKGIEAAKGGLSDEAWLHLTTELEKKQNDDTKTVVKERTA